MAKLLFLKMSFSVSLHFILLIKFNHPYLILFHPFFYPFAVFLMISSFGSFTHLEIVQSVTNVSTPTVSPLTTNTYDSVASHRAFSHDQIQEDLAFVPMQHCKNTHSMFTQSKAGIF